MTDTTLRPGRGRRPAAEVRAAALDATLATLVDESLREVTFEKIAGRAGVSKMTLYKWWSSPGAMAMEAYFASLRDVLAFTDTGDIAADLRTQLRAFVRVVARGSHGRVFRQLAGAAQTDPELAAVISREYTRPRRDLAVERLKQAQDQGQIRRDAHPEVIVDQLWGACYHRLLLPEPGAPITAGFADQLVTNVLRGVASS